MFYRDYNTLNPFEYAKGIAIKLLYTLKISL